MPDPKVDVLHGTLDVLILKTLSWGPAHGYAIAAHIKQRSGAAVLIEEGALYPALHRLLRKKWVETEWGVSENNRRARYYRLTAAGRQRLRVEVAAWTRYAAAVGKVLKPAR
ncbi:MAG: PadR family transcriptional regulator [Gemmatimonadales bacterium]|nr:PadR family transcriptional regulator [Gemmatimonadales bacterium]